jgi:hemerythrin-like domain-containing protein
MTKASEDLKHEHEAVLIALKILEQVGTMLQSGNEVDHDDLKKIIYFFKLFTATCHHGKEEKFFFPVLEEAGIARENGPIGVMLAEHEQGRIFLAAMNQALAEPNPHITEFLSNANKYNTLLKSHINKENNILFPMGDLRLSAAKQKELLEKFEQFEDEVIGKGQHEKLHNLLKELQRKYKPL